MNQELDFKEIAHAESARTYIFASGEVTVRGAKRICVRPSGGHRLETESGEKVIVSPGWLAIRLEAERWSF